MGCLTTQVEKGPIIASWVAQLEVNFTSVAQLVICICKFYFFDWINGWIKNGEINEQKLLVGLYSYFGCLITQVEIEPN